MPVYSMIAAGAMRYIRAKSAEQARVRGYKCFGQPFKVTKVGNWVGTSVGKAGYDDWVRAHEKQARREYYPPVADEAERAAPDAQEIQRLMAMIGMH